ncbi:MAG: YajQ family cyclic di-GMP-binding protein [Chitinophagaceae bacterium]
MPSFDITSKVEIQVLDNAINTVKKELSNRFDFKGSHLTIELDKKNYQVQIEAESDMKMEQILDVLVSRSMRQGVEANSYDLSKESSPSGKIIKKTIPVKNGIAQESAKKIVKLIKDSGLKVQAAIMDDMIRVTGKKIDDLQDVIQLCKGASLDLPLQFVNMKN